VHWFVPEDCQRWYRRILHADWTGQTRMEGCWKTSPQPSLSDQKHQEQLARLCAEISLQIKSSSLILARRPDRDEVNRVTRDTENARAGAHEWSHQCIQLVLHTTNSSLEPVPPMIKSSSYQQYTRNWTSELITVLAMYLRFSNDGSAKVIMSSSLNGCSVSTV
jgi:hypothetical protein